MSAPPKNSFIPPIITTAESKGSSHDNKKEIFELTAAIDNVLQSYAKQATTDDSLTTEETSVDYSTELEYSIADEDESDELSATSSYQSSPSSSSDDEDSTRRLLKQAHQRLEHQSIYEEVKLLRTQLNQKLEIVNKCNNLEQQLSKANQTIELYKQKEKNFSEEMAKCEMQFMNKLNEMCGMMEVEIVKRDERILELQNRLNEKETRTIMNRSQRLKGDVAAARGGAGLGDECFSDFIWMRRGKRFCFWATVNEVFSGGMFTTINELAHLTLTWSKLIWLL